MKNWLRVLWVIPLLLMISACGKTETEPDMSTSVTQSNCQHSIWESPLELPLQFAVGSDGIYGMMVDSKSTHFYRLSTDSAQPETSELFSLDYNSAKNEGHALLGADGEDHLWVAYSSQTHWTALCFAPDGSILMEIPFGTRAETYNIESFAWDTQYYYFIVNMNQQVTGSLMNEHLFVYDKSGQLVTQKPLYDLSAETQGYLPIEEEWIYELEGREENELYKILFPSGSTDSFKLTRLPNGQVAILIYRNAPIGQDTYVIVCPLNPADFSTEAIAYFHADFSDYPELVCLPTTSALEEYELIFYTPDGLMGLSLGTGQYDLLVPWSEIGYAFNNRTETIATMEDGTILLMDRNHSSRKWRIYQVMLDK